MRKVIGYLGREPVIFKTSVRRNLLLANPDASEQDIEDALRAANAWSFVVEKLEDGIDTVIGGQTGILSRGQKQRIALARAFIKKPRILLLDEAMTGLDKINEQAIEQAIDNYKKQGKGAAVITISRKVETIKQADKVVVLKNGVLTEMGTHDTILMDYPEGSYADMVAVQQAKQEYGEESDE